MLFAVYMHKCFKMHFLIKSGRQIAQKHKTVHLQIHLGTSHLLPGVCGGGSGGGGVCVCVGGGIGYI